MALETMKAQYVQMSQRGQESTLEPTGAIEKLEAAGGFEPPHEGFANPLRNTASLKKERRYGNSDAGLHLRLHSLLCAAWSLGDLLRI